MLICSLGNNSVTQTAAKFPYEKLNHAVMNIFLAKSSENHIAKYYEKP